MPRVRGCAATAAASPEAEKDTKSQADAEKKAEEFSGQTENKEEAEKVEQPKRKKKKEVVGETQADDDDEAEMEAPQKKKQKAEPREKAATNTYWLGIASESGVSAQVVKKVLAAVKAIASRDLQDENIGSFKLHGICTFTVKELKYREPYTRVVKGNKITVSEREPFKKMNAKSLLGIAGLSD